MAEDQYYVTVSRHPRGDAYIAIITLGSPQLGDKHVVVCDMQGCETEAKGQAWGKAQVADPEWHKLMAREMSKRIKVKP